MSVRSEPLKSEPLKDGAAVEKEHELVSRGLWPASIALVIVGGLLWLAGAKYTLLGWVAGLNWFMGWLDLPARIPSPTGYYMLLLIPVGLLYSLIEGFEWWVRSSGEWKHPHCHPMTVRIYV